MRTLWLHGMGARPYQFQLECLTENNLEPYALHLNYEKSTAYNEISEFIQENDIQFLIGRSHGGLHAYWLAEQFGLPCLAVNPHFSVRAKRFTSPAVSQNFSPLTLIVLGSDDELVDAYRSLLFIEQEKTEKPDKLILTKVLNGIGHWLDADCMNVHLRWALEEISKISPPQN